MRIEMPQDDGKLIVLYRFDGAPGAGAGNSDGHAAPPIVFSNDFMESGQAVLAQCEKLGCPPFWLASISNISWDSCLSPWPSEPVVEPDDDFEGRADEHLDWILEHVIPLVLREVDARNEADGGDATCTSADAPLYIAGYSMAGLFALWSLYRTNRFCGAASVSGSLWFPGFRAFALEHTLACAQQGKQPAPPIYLSIGDHESRTSNPALQLTEGICRELQQHYATAGVPSVFELNPGNHFKQPNLRMAKGITWLLQGQRRV